MNAAVNVDGQELWCEKAGGLCGERSPLTRIAGACKAVKGADERCNEGNEFRLSRGRRLELQSQKVEVA